MPILLLNQPFPTVGNTTFTFTVPTLNAITGGTGAGIYSVMAQLTVNPPSSVVITITQNGPTVYTSPVITPTQIAQQFKTELVCAAGDLITVVLSSANPEDLLLNTVAAQVTIMQGYV
jgi:hypothetical protein